MSKKKIIEIITERQESIKDDIKKIPSLEFQYKYLYLGFLSAFHRLSMITEEEHKKYYDEFIPSVNDLFKETSQ